MHPERLGFFARLWLAFVLPWQILFNAALAARVAAARSPQAHPDALPEPQDDGVLVVDDPTDLPPIVPELVPELVPEPHPATPAEPAGSDHTAALLLLSILQREGRFVDFLQEDVTDFGDADVGAAARVVHEGCKRALAQYLDIAPVRPEAEGAPITLPPGFDPTENRVTGNVTGEPPYRGRLAHPGWRVRDLDLPTVAPGHDASVIAPAEIEL